MKNWTAIMAFLVGVLVGLVTITNPILWIILIGAMLFGRLFHYMVNGV